MAVLFRKSSDRIYALARLRDDCPLPGLHRLGAQVLFITAEVLSALGLDEQRAMELLAGNGHHDEGAS
jgi:hypothetical protein